MNVKINHIRFVHKNGRPVAVAQLAIPNGETFNDTLGVLLTVINERNYILDNAQEILDTLVRINGFAA